MRASTSIDGHTVVVRLTGRLDRVTARRVWRIVETAITRTTHCAVVVIDVSRMVFLDSFGITTLLTVRQQARRQRVRLQVVATPGRVARRVLPMSGPDTTLTLYDSGYDSISGPPATMPTLCDPT